MALSAAALSVIGVCVGGLIGVAGSLLPFVFQRNAAKRSSGALAAAYVSGVLRMEEIRNRADQYRRTLESIRSGNPRFAKIFGAENATLADRDIQREILRQLGLLPPDVARDIIMFNNMLFGLRVNMRAMATGQMDDLSDESKAEILEADLKVWEDTLALGRSIVARLQ
jgi:hypothetical protein